MVGAERTRSGNNRGADEISLCRARPRPTDRPAAHLVKQALDDFEHLVLVDRIESSLDVHFDKVQMRSVPSVPVGHVLGRACQNVVRYSGTAHI